MPAFVSRSLVRAERPCRDIAVFLGPVVRCEDHESCLDELRVRLPRIGGLFQPIEHATESDVVLENVIVSRVHRLARLRAGRTGHRHTTDCLVGRVGAVVGIGRVVQEEWPGPGRCFADMAGQELHRVVRMTAAEAIQYVCVAAGDGDSLAVSGGGYDRAAMNVAGTPAARLSGRVRARSSVRARGEPRVIEAMVKRRGVQRLGQVCVLPSGCGRTVRTPVSKADVPLPEHCRRVTVVAQHGGDRGPVGLDHRIALGSVQHPVLQPAPPGITTRQQTVAGRRTPRRRRVGVSEADTHVPQALHLGCVQLDLVRIASEVLVRAGISHPHVISHHQDDIGLFGGRIHAGHRGHSENHREKGGPSAHYSNTLRDIASRNADKDFDCILRGGGKRSSPPDDAKPSKPDERQGLDSRRRSTRRSERAGTDPYGAGCPEVPSNWSLNTRA